MSQVYAMKAKDDDIRKKSTSGGMFSVLAMHVLSKGGVVYGAAFDENAVLKHIGIESIDELPVIRGTKYVRSNAGACFNELRENLEKQKIVLFCGTPCQNAALKQYIKDSSLQEYLIQVDFICMGLPTLTVFNEYKRWLEESKGKKLARILCRDKVSGWKQSSVRLTFQDGTEEVSSINKNEYLIPFLGEYGLSPACYKCLYRGKERPTDITMADFWGIQEIDPEMDDNIGTSLVFIHSRKGQELFSSVKKDMDYKEVFDEQYLNYNPYLVHSPARRIPNQYFYTHLGKMNYGKLIERCTFIYKARNKKDRIVKRMLGK